MPDQSSHGFASSAREQEPLMTPDQHRRWAGVLRRDKPIPDAERLASQHGLIARALELRAKQRR